MTTLPRWIFSLLVVLTTSLMSSYPLAATSVWKISQGANTLYLAGTFHLLNSEDHPLPAAFDQAYQTALKVVFETDIASTNSPAFQLKAAQVMMYGDGRTLKSALKPTTFEALNRFLLERGMAIDNFLPFTPAGASLVLSLLEYNRLGMSMQHGVEYVFNSQATKDNKATGFLETPEQQLQFIANLGAGEEDEMILYTLRDLKNSASLLRQFKTAWREGDIDTLDKVALKQMREEFPASYEDIIVNRNADWLPQIEAMIADPGTELVMVGALHMVGPDGLISRLRAKGYAVTQQ